MYSLKIYTNGKFFFWLTFAYILIFILLYSLEHPVAIYADFETISRKIHGCDPSPTLSYTNKKTLQTCSGYSYTVTSPHFPERTRVYTGEDAGEMFLRNILEEEKRVFSTLKKIEKKNHNLSEEEEKQWQEEKKCHICNDAFLKDDNPPDTKNRHHLVQIKHLLLANRLDSEKIPSIRKVKKQKKIISAQLHPDKQTEASDEEKFAKQEELKAFNVKNEELLAYLELNEIYVQDEEGEEFDLEDELTEEEMERIKKKGWKVRDHDHWTGHYRGAAHSGCNIALRKTKRLPVIFHNLTGYDAHIIFQSISKVQECKDPKVISKSMEKFIGFTIGKLCFMDSLQHLSTSLDKLTSNLAAKALIKGCRFCQRRGPKKSIERHERIAHKKEIKTEYKHKKKSLTLTDLFPNLHKNFKKKWKHLPEKAFEMLTRKGVYPYAYMDSMSKFQETQLPPKESFYNDLSKKAISDEDFEFVHQLWETFNLKNLKELHELYMETDTLLLADVFESYRKSILKNYGLDPVHFYTAPALSWAAGLKFTGVKLEIPSDVNMHIFFDQGLTGGISMAANHFARANNKLMKEYYDPKLKQSYILLVDANNLYGWAMSQFLPTGGFKWVFKLKTDVPAITNGNKGYKSMDEWEQDIMKLKDDDDTGYMFQVDLEYPENLHLDEMHDNFPLAPESCKIEKEMLSSYQTTLGDSLNVAYGSEKLCLTLKDKKEYICHYRNLKFYLKHGMKLKKIHKILQFDQSAWLKPYIDHNTRMRQQADNKFDEDQAKLMNNAFFGKFFFLIINISYLLFFR